jgi:cation diffusion facilitator family transporter
MESAATLPPSLTRYAWLSIAAAIATILLKGVAWWLTGSVGLLSDAIESFVNLAGALMALWMLTLAARPADDNHAYGYSKAEYFSSAFEGFLILLAAVSIGYTAIVRLMNPQSLEAVGIGLLVSVVASVINFATARILMSVGREHNSITLEADAHHLMTDVWTSAGVIAGVGLVWLTGWLWLDPVIALLVAANIVWTGLQLMRRSAAGLMDVSLPVEKLEQIEALLAGYRRAGAGFPRPAHPPVRQSYLRGLARPGTGELDGTGRSHLGGAYRGRDSSLLATRSRHDPSGTIGRPRVNDRPRA